MDSKTWYAQLNKPSWAPEPWVFGRVWSFLYIIIFGVNIYVATQVFGGELEWVIALPFWLNLFLNLIFSPIQFGLKNNLLSASIIYGIFATLLWAMVAIWPFSTVAALLFIPYLIWVSIAGVLQTSIWWLNR